jgi:hypothetical protein
MPESSISQTIVAAALIGTQRQPFTPPLMDGMLGELLAKIEPTNQEVALLSAATAILLYQKAGQLLIATDSPLAQPCDLDDLPRCNDRAASYVKLAMSAEYIEVLPECLAAVAGVGQRIPEKSLSNLLDLGKRQSHLREAIAPVLGKRGVWLAAQNSEWNYIAGDDRETVWETGSSAARLAWLKQQRYQEPDRAREHLESTWKDEVASDRTTLIEALQIGLSIADEPFLESALDDRSKEVRRVAAELLACLPASRLCQRSIERAHPLLELDTEAGELVFKVILPETCDKSAIRDGIEPKSKDAKLGDRSWWFLQTLSATPLSLWNQTWSKSASDLIEIAQHQRSDGLVLRGFAIAAELQKEANWIEAIFASDAIYTLQSMMSENIGKMLKVLPFERQESIKLKVLRSQGSQSNLAGVLLYKDKTPWSTEISQVVLKDLSHSTANCSTDRDYSSVVQSLSLYAILISPSSIPQAIEIVTALAQKVEQLEDSTNNYYTKNLVLKASDKFIAMVKFRQGMLEAINERGKSNPLPADSGETFKWIKTH